MTVYLVYMAIFSILSFVKISGVKDKRLLQIGLFALYVLATIRSLSIGNDTRNYYDLFNDIAINGYDESYTYRFEIGYLILTRAIGWITHNYIIYLAIIDGIIYYAYYIFIRDNSSNYGLSLFLFLALGAWGRTANVIRLELAIAMFLYAYAFKKSGRIIEALLLGILAIAFQRVAIVFFCLFFMPKKVSTKAYIIVASLAAGILALMRPVFQIVGMIVPYYAQYYLNSEHYVFGEIKLSILLQFLLQMVAFFTCLHIYRINKNHLKEEMQQGIEMQLNIVFVSVMVLFLALRFNLLDRCGLLFGNFMLLLLPNAVLISKNKKILTLFIVLLGLGYFIAVNTLRPDWNHIIPYHTFLFEG